MNQTINDLLTRRSVRAYTAQQVQPDVLDTILEAGTYAPSGMGKQSSIMVVVQDADTIHQLDRMNAQVMGNPDAHPLYGAPTAVVVLADRQVSTARNDGSLVMGNLMVAAHALGVASCWINRAREMFDGEEGKALLKKWGVEGDYEGVAICILGYAEGPAPSAKPRKANYIYKV